MSGGGTEGNVKIVSDMLFCVLLAQDMCRLCVEHKCVLPSLESIQRRWDDPKTYCIFYMYFYTSAVGEVRWKEYLSKEEGRIGSNTMEAFALLVLENNYKAWLYEEKKTHQKGLYTEYDSPPSSGMPSIVDKLLDGVQFDLAEEANPAVIYDNKNKTYKRLAKEREQWLEGFVKKYASKTMCNDVLDRASNESIDDDNGEDDVNQDIFIQRERSRKARKLTKGLRQFTGVAADGERKCKGWSDEGMVAFEKHLKVIKKDVEDGKYQAWERAYREVIQTMDHSNNNGGVPLQKEKYKPNLGLVYEGFD